MAQLLTAANQGQLANILQSFAFCVYVCRLHTLYMYMYMHVTVVFWPLFVKNKYYCNLPFFSLPPGNDSYTGIAARDTANALKALTHAVRGVAAGTKKTQTQEFILGTAQHVSLHVTY